MSYQLNKNSETQENQEESWYVRGWGNYETTSGDGGFLDSFNALKQQMDFVANQYRVQMESMAQRKQDMLKDIRDNIWITVGLALGPFLYNLFVLLLMHISVYSGLLSIICIFLEIAEIPLFIVCEFYILPGQIRRLGNRLWQKKVLNSGPELAEYRKKHGIISFEDERMFLEEKLQEQLLEKAKGHYLVCFIEHCPLHSHCLRWLVGQHADTFPVSLTVVNPRHAGIGTEQCEMYCSDERVTMKYGLTRLYDDIPARKATAIRHQLIERWGRKFYFQMRRGDRPITPAQQQDVADVCRSCGWTGPIVYDAEDSDWQW